MVTRAARVDDEDNFEPDLLARGKRLYRDGKGPRVPMMLTDGQPEWMRTLRGPVFDARNHQPHFADVTYASLRDARLAAHDARAAMIARLSDAWKVQPGGAGGEPLTTAPGAEPGAMTMTSNRRAIGTSPVCRTPTRRRWAKPPLPAPTTSRPSAGTG
jgi:hypothetical protein